MNEQVRKAVRHRAESVQTGANVWEDAIEPLANKGIGCFILHSEEFSPSFQRKVSGSLDECSLFLNFDVLVFFDFLFPFL